MLNGKKDKAGEPIHADSAYIVTEQEQIIASHGLENKVCEKGKRNHLLTEEQKASNIEKSRVRSQKEHIFGFMENSVNGMYFYNIEIKRISSIVGLTNFTYNMFRKIQLSRTLRGISMPN